MEYDQSSFLEIQYGASDWLLTVDFYAAQCISIGRYKIPRRSLTHISVARTWTGFGRVAIRGDCIIRHDVQDLAGHRNHLKGCWLRSCDNRNFVHSWEVPNRFVLRHKHFGVNVRCGGIFDASDRLDLLLGIIFYFGAEFTKIYARVFGSLSNRDSNIGEGRT
jgi:hypothetical protein